MERDIIVRKVTQDVMLFVWFKHGALSEEPPRETNQLIPEISVELINNLSVSVWIESFRGQFIWEDFFKTHFKRMSHSTELFTKYVSFICYVLNRCPNSYECFFDILSFVTEVSLRCLEEDCKAYVNTCVDLFCSFFEQELCKKFECQGSWKKFNNYLLKQHNLMRLKSLDDGEKSPIELFKYFQITLERVHLGSFMLGGIFPKEKSPAHYVVNGCILKDVTQEQVETDKKAIEFAESIQKKVKELFRKTFDEIIMDFAKTYRKVKDLNRPATVKASTWNTGNVAKSFLQKGPKAPDVRKKTGQTKQIVEKRPGKTKNEAPGRTINETGQSIHEVPNKYCSQTLDREKELNRQQTVKTSTDISNKLSNPLIQKDENTFDVTRKKEQSWTIVRNTSGRKKNQKMSEVKNEIKKPPPKDRAGFCRKENEIEQSLPAGKGNSRTIKHELKQSSEYVQKKPVRRKTEVEQNSQKKFQGVTKNEMEQSSQKNKDLRRKQPSENAKKASDRKKTEVEQNSQEQVQEVIKNETKQSQNVLKSFSEASGKKPYLQTDHTKFDGMTDEKKQSSRNFEIDNEMESVFRKLDELYEVKNKEEVRTTEDQEEFFQKSNEKQLEAPVGAKSKRELSLQKDKTASCETIEKMKKSSQDRQASSEKQIETEQSLQKHQKVSGGKKMSSEKAQKATEKIPGETNNEATCKMSNETGQYLHNIPIKSCSETLDQEKELSLQASKTSTDISDVSNKLSRPYLEKDQNISDVMTRKKEEPWTIVKNTSGRKKNQKMGDVKKEIKKPPPKDLIEFCGKENEIEQPLQTGRGETSTMKNEFEQSSECAQKKPAPRKTEVEQNTQEQIQEVKNEMEQSQNVSKSLSKTNGEKPDLPADHTKFDGTTDDKKQFSQKVEKDNEMNLVLRKLEESYNELKNKEEVHNTKDQEFGRKSNEKKLEAPEEAKSKLELNLQEDQTASCETIEKIEKSSQKQQQASSEKQIETEQSLRKRQKVSGCEKKSSRKAQNATINETNEIELSSQKAIKSSIETKSPKKDLKANEIKQSLLRDESGCERIFGQTEGKTIQDLDLSKIQTLDGVSNQHDKIQDHSSDIKPKPRKTEKAEKLLTDMSFAIEKLTELILQL